MNRLVRYDRSPIMTGSILGPMFLSLVIGATAGALLVALNTNKPDPELERRAKALARSSKRGSKAVAEDLDGLMDDWKAPVAEVAGDLKRNPIRSLHGE